MKRLVLCFVGVASLLVPLTAAADPLADSPETPAQREFRTAYITKTSTRIREICDGNHKARTPEENTEIGTHWHRAMRAIRVREVMEDEGDKATVARVDALLVKADTKLFTKLVALAKAAPQKAKAPVVELPKAATKVRLNESFVCKQSAYANATACACGVEQDGHRVFFRCNNDTHEAQMNLHSWKSMFHPGPAHLLAEVDVDKHWSEMASVDIGLEPSDAAPAPKVLAPEHGQTLRVGQPVAFKFEEYPTATSYACRVFQGPVTHGAISATPDCTFTLAADKDHPYHQGYAEAEGMAMVKGKWSEPSKFFVQVISADTPDAPKVVSPVKGDKVNLDDKKLTCKLEPVANATQYECRLNQTGGGWTHCIGKTPDVECPIAVKTRPGAATIYAQVKVGDKASAFSRGFNVEVTGHALPAPSGSGAPTPAPSGSAKGGTK